MRIKLALILSLAISILFTSFTGLTVSAATGEPPAGYVQVPGNGNTVLYYNPAADGIAVLDKSTGYLWKANPDKEAAAVKASNAELQNYMASAFAITYTDKKKNEGSTSKAYSQQKDVERKVESIQNGVSFQYYFKNLSIRLVIEYRMKGDTLTVSIPSGKIEESGNYGLVSLELLPFFGASDHTVNGYILYPDGSGAIMENDSSVSHPQSFRKTYTWNVYGSKQFEWHKYMEMNSNQKFEAMLPVFGIKNGENAMLAAIAKGEADALINLSPEGHAVAFNRIGFEFVYRNKFDVMLSNITVNGTGSAKKPVATKIDREIIRQDREVNYTFLSKEQANYSGMANAYRKYLLDNKLLKKSAIAKDSIPLALDLFMGVKEKQMLFDKFITMTSFSQAQSITQKFMDSGVKALQVKLSGWTEDGYGKYPMNWPPDKRLGGVKGLSTYADYADKQGIPLFLQSNFVFANSSNKGFSTRNDVVVQGSKIALTDSSKTGFLLNPFSAFERLMAYLNQSTKYKVGGVAFEKTGELIYNDYNKGNPFSRTQTVEKWKEEMKIASEKTGLVAVEGGNSYVLSYADRLYDIPSRSSDYFVTDNPVPFYQMVVHGYISYTSEPGNLFYDTQKQKLKWIEYGCIPYYELTWEKAKSLKFTEYNRLFSSYYDEWTDKAADVYKEFNQRLKETANEAMVSHEKLGEELYLVKYGNGSAIYINYSDKETVYNGNKIGPLDYLVLDKGGNRK